MVHYFYLLEEAFFEHRLRPTLGQCRHARSFEPCHALCQEILDQDGHYGRDSLMAQVTRGLSFRSTVWQAVVGELLVAGAVETPRLAIEPAWLVWLLARKPHDDSPRAEFASIQQVLFGGRDLTLGSGCYRPDHAGYNAVDDLPCLIAYLKGQYPTSWRAEDLRSFPAWDADQDPVEEITELALSWSDLLDLYRHAHERKWVIVCEEP